MRYMGPSIGLRPRPASARPCPRSPPRARETREIREAAKPKTGADFLEIHLWKIVIRAGGKLGVVASVIALTIAVAGLFAANLP
jgi:hypothetical protein